MVIIILRIIEHYNSYYADIILDTVSIWSIWLDFIVSINLNIVNIMLISYYRWPTPQWRRMETAWLSGTQAESHLKFVIEDTVEYPR